MASIDYKSDLYAAVWGLLQGNAAFASLTKPGTLISYATTAGVIRKKILRGVADFPRVELELSDGAVSNSGKGPQVTPRPFVIVDVPIWVRQSLRLTITYDNAQQTLNTPLDVAVRAALTSGLPKMGLSYVANYAWTENRGTVADQGVTRTQLVLTLTATLTIPLSQFKQ